ncbi:NAD-dependent epimerase/dehydratase family protein [Stutzerimonas balearica]|uniref:NAD-dependent epimerase/dehydratase family protein n=1 Tax=Stutzerimonas balearica TaxID=74829 RepID=UPI000B025051|nr:NAD(P)-dependent oxidoreductase [Stutzerimonas balearica]
MMRDQLHEMGKAGMDYQGAYRDSSAIFSVEHLPVLQSLADALEGRHLLVTGGTGFFGRWLLALFQALQARGARFEVTVVSRDPERFLMHWPTFRGCRWLHWVAKDVRLIPSGLSIDLVVHAAADTSAVAQRDALELFDIITEGARRVCELAVASGSRRVLLIGSGAQYGALSGSTPIAEDDARACASHLATSAYGEGKRVQEMLGAMYAQKHGLEVVMTRCFAFSGAGLALDGHFAIGNFVRDALFADRIVINSNGRAVRSYLHGADLAGWLLTILFEGKVGQVYNVGSDQALSIAEIARRVIARLAPHKELEIRGADEDARRSFYVPDISRARSLGLDVWTPLEASIDNMATLALASQI